MLRLVLAVVVHALALPLHGNVGEVYRPSSAGRNSTARIGTALGNGGYEEQHAGIGVAHRLPVVFVACGESYCFQMLAALMTLVAQVALDIYHGRAAPGSDIYLIVDGVCRQLLQNQARTVVDNIRMVANLTYFVSRTYGFLFKPCATTCLYLPAIIPERRFLYLDSDVLVAGSLSPVSNIMAASEEDTLFMAEEVVSSLCRDCGYYHRLSLFSVMAGATGYNSGVIGINAKEWRRKSLEGQVDKALEMIDCGNLSTNSIESLGDQDVFNLLIKQGDARVKPLPCGFNLREDSLCFCGSVPCMPQILHGNREAFYRTWSIARKKLLAAADRVLQDGPRPSDPSHLHQKANLRWEDFPLRLPHPFDVPGSAREAADCDHAKGKKAFYCGSHSDIILAYGFDGTCSWCGSLARSWMRQAELWRDISNDFLKGFAKLPTHQAGRKAVAAPDPAEAKAGAAKAAAASVRKTPEANANAPEAAAPESPQMAGLATPSPQLRKRSKVRTGADGEESVKKRSRRHHGEFETQSPEQTPEAEQNATLRNRPYPPNTDMTGLPGPNGEDETEGRWLWESRGYGKMRWRWKKHKPPRDDVEQFQEVPQKMKREGKIAAKAKPVTESEKDPRAESTAGSTQPSLSDECRPPPPAAKEAKAPAAPSRPRSVPKARLVALAFPKGAATSGTPPVNAARGGKKKDEMADEELLTSILGQDGAAQFLAATSGGGSSSSSSSPSCSSSPSSGHVQPPTTSGIQQEIDSVGIGDRRADCEFSVKEALRPPSKAPSAMSAPAVASVASGTSSIAMEAVAAPIAAAVAHQAPPPPPHLARSGSDTPEEAAERFRLWEENLKKVIGAGPTNADRAVREVLRRARSGEPCGIGLPVLSFEEARLRVLRCGGKEALDRERVERTMAKAAAAAPVMSAGDRGVQPIFAARHHA